MIYFSCTERKFAFICFIQPYPILQTKAVHFMKNTKRILGGIVIIAAGVLFALNALDIINFSIFFDGWWTLFIIIPCAAGLITQQEKTGNLIGLLVGVFLLLCCQDVLSFSLLWKLLLPAIIVIIGVKMVFSGFFNSKATEIFSTMKQDGKNL